MTTTHDLGRLFWHTVKLTDAPLVHRGKTSMTESPYYWSRPLIIRLTRETGLVFGVWRKHRDLDVSRHLAQALVLNPDVLKVIQPPRVGYRLAPLIKDESKFYGADLMREP